jgi:protein-S-isoprenylcysteine O-methyltransferase Ste14
MAIMTANGIVTGSAALAAVHFTITHVRVSRNRAETPDAESGRRSAPWAMAGLAVEAVGFSLLFVWPDRAPLGNAVWHWSAVVLALASTWTVAAATRALGRQWRVQAVVTNAHKLVTSGPYRVVRHPIYAAGLGDLLALGLAFSNWPPILAATAVYLLGTEIRVRAEDALLAERFGSEFLDYRRHVKAYVPFLR